MTPEVGSCAWAWPYTSYIMVKKKLPGIYLTNYVYSNDDHGMVYQNFKFHYPQDMGPYSENAILSILLKQKTDYIEPQLL